MIVRPKMHLLASMLALSVTVAMAAPANAQYRQHDRSQGTDLSLQINFGSTPHFVGIPGTPVREIRQGDRADYDMFQYGRSYYAYNNDNGRWYMSRRSRGQFRLIDDRYVPTELRRVPRNHWRNYPTAWEDRNYRGSRGTSSSLRVSYGSRPHWTGIRGTRVETVSVADRPDYDLFRYGNTYYAYDNNRWYSSDRESGDFMGIDERSVPSELSRVPRDQWRDYPTAWEDRNYRGSRGTSSSLRVTFGNRPHWTGIGGTRVEMVAVGERPNYDVFRYGSTYYAFDNNQWYSSDRESGDFMGIDERSVPSELSRVPRDQWRDYPASWQGRDPYQDQRRNR